MTRLRALWAEPRGGGPAYDVAFREVDESDLPDEEVTVEIVRSSLNYKDALGVTGRGKIFRRLPMIPGIDLAGVVRASRAPTLPPGARVLGVGQGLGESAFGGYAERQRVRADALVPIPAGRDEGWAMGLGTAGFTAMLALAALERHGVRPGGRPVIVTGAAGGVGSIAVLLLARAGFEVAASTGRPEAHEYLRALGATTIVDRAILAAAAPPLGRERWAGAIDAVGGTTLASVIAQTARDGAVAACGLAGGAELPTTAYPFILRGVALLGIASGEVARAARLEAWERLAALAPPDALAPIVRTEPLSQVGALSEAILAGQVRGRIVLDVTA
jgi:acrylyl-CoA reductase (NADPH)